MAADPHASEPANRLAHWARNFADEHRLDSAELSIAPPLHPDEVAGLGLALGMNLVTIETTGQFRLAGADAGKGPYNLFSRGRAPALNREYLIQIAAFAELVAHHGWPASQVAFEYDAFDLAVLDASGRLVVAAEAKRDQRSLETTLAKLSTATPDELATPATADQRKAAALVRLRPQVFCAIAPGVRRWFTLCVDDGSLRLVPCEEPPRGPRGDVDCPICGAEEDVRGTPAPGGRIRLSCAGCGHRWSRTPRHPCPRCGSGEVEESGYTGWSYEDVEEAREDPNAEWYYVDWQVFRCRNCRNVWQVGSRAQ
ncbi:MAG TPA: hypothetical protein VFU43_01600 [Streptosporangiaceae bacterium]|nr:hypothetical protein [Streptosporangiaceae bacterium]